jgi:hypothetical protein
MATPAQIAANQANAAHSTGPRTEEGKTKTRSNATQHGLCGTTAPTSDAVQTVFNHLHDDLLREYRPATPTEEILIFKMAVHFYAFARAEDLLAERLALNESQDESKQLALMMRYQSTADRQFNRNLNDLRKIQKERRCPRVQPDGTTAPSAACSQTQGPILPTGDLQREDAGLEPRAMERDRSIGFVSSTAGTDAKAAPAQPAAAPEIGSVPQNAASRAAQTHNFAQKTEVCVTAAPENDQTTDRADTSREISVKETGQMNPSKAA